MSENLPPKTMLILKGETSVLAAETFLKNREWELFSTTDIKEALSYAMQKKPTYIMISVNHSNTKVTMVPKILKQTSPFTIIAFAEKNTPASEKLLDRFDADYKVSPPTTGPAIERCVNKHIRDLNKKDAPSDKTFFSSDGSDDDEVIIQKGSKSDSHMAPVSNRQSEMNKATEGAGPSKVMSHSGSATNMQGASGKANEGPGGSNIATRNFNNESTNQKLNPKSNWVPVEKNQRAKKNRNGNSLSFKPDSEFSTYVQSSLTEACQSEYVTATSSGNAYPQPAANAVTILIETGRVTGYLVLTSTNLNSAPDLKLVEIFKTKLLSFLGRNQKTIPSQETIPVRIKDVEFDAFSDVYADFFKSSPHLSSHISIAFFPKKELKLTLQPSPGLTGMSQININDLVGDQIVHFDLFIFLVQNNKVLLCAAKGNVFHEKQRQRFIQQGLTHLHVLENASLDVTKYHTENYLNNLVDVFHASEES